MVSQFSGQDKQGVLRCVWQTGTWRLFPFLLIYSTGFATVFPVIPTLVANGFASQAAGHPVQCQTYAPADQPPECRQGHVQAVAWNAWTSFVSSSILSCLFAPAVGRLSDRVGRKPFMLAGVALAIAPMCMLMVHCWGWVPIEWYYPVSALNGMVSSFSMALMSVADRVHQMHRAAAVGYLSACFSIGIIVGPLIGGFIDTNMAGKQRPIYVPVYACIALIGATLVYVAIFVQETAPRVVAARKAASDARARSAATEAKAGAAGVGDLEQPLLRGTPSNPMFGTRFMHGPGSDEEEDEDHEGGRAQSEDAAHGCTCNDPTPALDFDPIPNMVPHVHEHTLLVSLSVRTSRMCCGGLESATPSPTKLRGGMSPLKSRLSFEVIREHGPAGRLTPKALKLDEGSSSSSEAEGGATHAGSDNSSACARRCGGATGGCPGGCGPNAPCQKPPAGLGFFRSRLEDMCVGLRVIKDSPWYQKLVIVWVVVSMTFEGAQDLLMQYLGMQLQFDVPDTARLLFIVAISGLAIKLGALSTLVRVLGEQGLLVLGLTAYMVQDILLALADTKLMAQVAVGVGSLSCVCWPASVALQTKHVAPEDMGAVQGALEGISSLASGVGPLAFAALFAAFSMPERSHLPNFPQIVWYLAAALSLLAALLTATLHWNEPKKAAAPVPPPPLQPAEVTTPQPSAAAPSTPAAVVVV